MKLCHIVPSLDERHGGPSKSVRSLCRALADAGQHVDLFTTTPRATSIDDGSTEGRLRIRAFKRDWPERLCPSRALRTATLTTTSEIVHHHSIWLRTLHYARLGAHRAGAALVVSPRGMMSRWAWHHHHWRKQIALQFIHPRAFSAVDGWHVTSPEEEKEIRELGFTQPICIAPNGIEPPEQEEVGAAAAFWREQCPDIDRRRVALFYSRFHPKKRVLELIDLWLERAPSDWLLLLVGIPQEYSPEMIEQYIVNMSGSGRIRAFNGIGRPPPYEAASLFVLPSHNENFGMAIAEAMAHGVPALVTDTTPWAAVNALRCGWCVPWTDFGDALVSALNEPANTLKRRGADAREWVLREFSWAQAATKLGRFYAQLRSKAN